MPTGQRDLCGLRSRPPVRPLQAFAALKYLGFGFLGFFKVIFIFYC